MLELSLLFFINVLVENEFLSSLLSQLLSFLSLILELPFYMDSNPSTQRSKFV